MRLTICIPTMNRAAFIGATLDSILPQLQADMEVVIVDGGSQDGTANIVAQRAAGSPQVRYHRTRQSSDGTAQPSNVGYDRDCDYAIELARGRYCWIVPDDDLVVEGGILQLATHLERGVALIVANAQVRSFDLTTVLEDRRILISQDAFFSIGEAGRLFALTGNHLSYAGGVVVRRDWWLSRDRARYFGTAFVHVGALFQQTEDLDAVVVAQPLIWLRYGNSLWSRRAFELWMYLWPDLIWSFPIADSDKAVVIPREPWRSMRTLAVYRARGCFGLAEFLFLMKRSRPSFTFRFRAAMIMITPAWSLSLLAIGGTYLRRGRHNTAFIDFWCSPCNLLRHIFRIR
jgi:glycosyltransferase involved in cell wall biosynthesis